jgi:hypothetical protein
MSSQREEAQTCGGTDLVIAGGAAKSLYGPTTKFWEEPTQGSRCAPTACSFAHCTTTLGQAAFMLQHPCGSQWHYCSSCPMQAQNLKERGPMLAPAWASAAPQKTQKRAYVSGGPTVLLRHLLVLHVVLGV